VQSNYTYAVAKTRDPVGCCSLISEHYQESRPTDKDTEGYGRRPRALSVNLISNRVLAVDLGFALSCSASEEESVRLDIDDHHASFSNMLRQEHYEHQSEQLTTHLLKISNSSPLTF
jgi:hypothetical protein